MFGRNNPFDWGSPGRMDFFRNTSINEIRRLVDTADTFEINGRNGHCWIHFNANNMQYFYGSDDATECDELNDLYSKWKSRIVGKK